MLKMNVMTKRKPEDVVKQAVEFFGPNGYGMKVTNRNDTCVSFEGGGGVVAVTCTDGKGTSVDLESREWDGQVKEFAGKIKR